MAYRLLRILRSSLYAVCRIAENGKDIPAWRIPFLSAGKINLIFIESVIDRLSGACYD